MSRVRDAFADGKAFIPFVTAGDPELAVTEELIVAMAGAGADLIEIGIPVSYTHLDVYKRQVFRHALSGEQGTSYSPSFGGMYRNGTGWNGSRRTRSRRT